MIANIANSHAYKLPDPTGLNIHIPAIFEEKTSRGSRYWTQVQVRNGHKQPPEDVQNGRPTNAAVLALAPDQPAWDAIAEAVEGLRAQWGDLPVCVAETRGV